MHASRPSATRLHEQNLGQSNVAISLTRHVVTLPLQNQVGVDLWQDAIDRRYANNATGKSHEAQQEQVPAVS